MAVFLSPVGGAGAQFCDNNGNPLNGGKLYTYAAGTTTPAATYTSSAGVTFHSNPIILNAGGRVPDSGEIWLADSVIYKFVLKTSTDVLIATWDQITGINSNFVNFTTETEVQTATAGQTVFTLTTMTYAPSTGSLTVYVDGVNQYEGTSYLETNSTTVTFTAGLHVGAEVKFTTAVQTTGNATDASVVSYTPPFTGGVSTTVEAKLAQTVSIVDFGADPANDAAANTAAIEAAMAASTSVMVPEGTFECDVIAVASDVTLFGSSRGGSVLTTTGSALLNIESVSNVTVESLTLTSTGTSYGNTVFVHGAASQVRVRNCTITSAYRTFMAGDNADTSGPTYVWFENNTTRTTNPDGGIRTRRGSNGSGGIMWFTNNLIVNSNNTVPGSNNYEDVGIETWTPASTIEGNVIVAEHLLGGFSGITFGVAATGIARNNRITGFSAGVEMGNNSYGAMVVDGNIIENCKEGILVSTGGLEESVTITNNQIIMDEINRSDYTYAIYVQCQAATITNNFVYYKNGSTTYVDATSRKGTGVRGDTNNEQMLVMGNVFKNLETGIDLAATGKDIQVVGNDFYNVGIPVYDTGGSPNTYFANNNVQEFKYFQINLYANFCNNEIARSSNYPNGQGTSISSSPFVQSLNSANVVIVNSNNRFTNVLGTAWAFDGEYYAQGGGYTRPKVEVINGTYKVANYADPAAATAILTTCGFDPVAKNILEWYTGTTYVVNAGSLVTTQASAAPTSGTWKRGDIVWQTTPTSGATPGWMCTTAGTPGTWKAMANLA